MIFATLMASLVSQFPSEVTLDQIIQASNETVLSGGELSAEITNDIGMLENEADRLMAIIYLRRTGLFSGPRLEPPYLIGPRQNSKDGE